jgi:hypothetical protein
LRRPAVQRTPLFRQRIELHHQIIASLTKFFLIHWVAQTAQENPKSSNASDFQLAEKTLRFHSLRSSEHLTGEIVPLPTKEALQ